MMDVHEADGVVPSDTEGDNDGSSTSSTSSSASSTMMLFDKPQPLVLELHELKKTDQTPADKRVPVPPEHARGRRQPITCVTDKTRKLKKKRKPSTASKLTTDSAQANESSLLQALPLPTATTDAAKEEFFDAQDTVMPPENESDSKTSELAAADIEATMDAIAKDLDVPLRLNLPGHSQETDQLVPPAITEPFDAPPAPEAKMDAPQELVTTGIVGKELSQTNVKGIIQPQSMTSHRSIKKPVDRLEPQRIPTSSLTSQLTSRVTDLITDAMPKPKDLPQAVPQSSTPRGHVPWAQPVNLPPPKSKAKAPENPPKPRSLSQHNIRLRSQLAAKPSQRSADAVTKFKNIQDFQPKENMK